MTNDKKGREKLSLDQLEKVTGGVSGTKEDDVLRGGDGNDRLYGGGGDDMIQGGDGNDKIFGDGGTARPGDDILFGGGGDDKLYGGGGSDYLGGGSGNDRLDGGVGEGDDVLDGGSGDDRFLYAKGDGDDVVMGGEGKDTIELLKFGNGAGWTISFGYGEPLNLTSIDLNLPLPETSGVITAPDGSTITFSGIERIVPHW